MGGNTFITECRKDSYEAWGLILTMMLSYCLKTGKGLNHCVLDFPILKKKNRTGGRIGVVNEEDNIYLPWDDATKPDV